MLLNDIDEAAAAGYFFRGRFLLTLPQPHSRQPRFGMNEKQQKKVSPPFQGGVVGTIDYHIFSTYYFPTVVVDSLFSSNLYWYEKSKSIKVKNSSNLHLGTSPLLLSTTPAGISICILIKSGPATPP